MAVLKQSIWTSTNCTESDAQSLANPGTVNAKATCDRIMKTMKEEAIAGQALETSAAKEN